MSKDTNLTILIGRLVRSAELRHTPSGAAVTDFTLAVGDSFTSNGEKKESVSFINLTAWNKTAEALVNYTDKGHRICVQGKLKQQSYDDTKTGEKRSSVSVTVESFQFLQPKGEGQPVAKEQPSDDGYKMPVFDPDDVPF